MSSFFPPGFKPGCLLKDHKPGEVCGLASDHIEIFTDEKIRELAGRVSLRNSINLLAGTYDIHNQNAAGSCAADSANGALRAKAIASGYAEYPRLNPWATYGSSVNGRRRGTSGGRDNGSSLRSNLVHLRDVGALPAVVFSRGNWGSNHIEDTPNASRLWAELPKGWERIAKFFRIVEFWEVGNVRELLSAALREFSITIGFSGHSEYVCDVLNENTIMNAGSWGDWTNMGIPGFRRQSVRNINFNYGAYAWRSVVDPTGWEEVAADVLVVDVSVIHERLALEMTA